MNKKTASLLELAERDISHAAANMHSFPSHAALSVQQAAEKMIKAILEVEGVSYPSTSHQLDHLIGLVPATNPFKGDLGPLARLTSAATKYRYPTPRGDIPQDPPEAETTADMEAIRLFLPDVKEWASEDR